MSASSAELDYRQTPLGVLLDIDHSPRNVLHALHAGFYELAGLRELAVQLHPGGVFALWSDDSTDEPFLYVLREVFDTIETHVVTVYNLLLECNSASTIYVARTR